MCRKLGKKCRFWFCRFNQLENSWICKFLVNFQDLCLSDAVCWCKNFHLYWKPRILFSLKHVKEDDSELRLFQPVSYTCFESFIVFTPKQADCYTRVDKMTCNSRKFLHAAIYSTPESFQDVQPGGLNLENQLLSVFFTFELWKQLHYND